MQEKQLEAQVDRHGQLAEMAQSIEAFCQRVQAGLAHTTFAQKRTLVELLIDRVLVAHGDVEIRYALPTHPRSETTRFCHLRQDYFDDVIEILDRADEDRGTVLLVVARDSRLIGRTPVDGNLLWHTVAADGLGEESLGGLLIALFGQQ